MSKTSSTSYFEGKDMLLLPDGSTYHLEIKPGDVFPRILTVGSKSRAELISKLFDDPSKTREIHSARDFHIYSGHFKKVGVTIIAIGMGAPMMDFMLREVSFVLNEKLAVIRLGTCGILNSQLNPGTVIVAGKGSHYVYSDYATIPKFPIKEFNPLHFFKVAPAVPADATLSNALLSNLQKKNLKHHNGLNASCENFYSCQGRLSDHFIDQGTGLMNQLISMNIDSLEMESHQLLFLSQVRSVKCHSTCAAIGIVNRTNHKLPNISTEDFKKMEKEAGEACLQTLAEFQF